MCDVIFTAPFCHFVLMVEEMCVYIMIQFTGAQPRSPPRGFGDQMARLGEPAALGLGWALGMIEIVELFS